MWSPCEGLYGIHVLIPRRHRVNPALQRRPSMRYVQHRERGLGVRTPKFDEDLWPVRVYSSLLSAKDQTRT